MSGAKEIRTKIKSIKSTQKITRAMEMVAASKMRKAQQRMNEARPYAEKIATVISHVAHSQPEYRHPYMISREEKNVGIILLSSDRGLCGGLNANMFRYLLQECERFEKEGKKVSFCAIGSKAEGFLKRFKVPILASASKIGDHPEIADVIGPVGAMLKSYDDRKLDSLYIYHNQFLNTMSQKPVIKKVLPIVPDNVNFNVEPSKSKFWDYIYEPDAKELLDLLLTRFLESQVYHAIVENFACEQSARMIAMKSASENAGELIDSLQLVYNKARQSAITQELSEIVSGAAAV
ncbi:F0F1 ATP synthase subunit gamma [Candidatus Berkiella cookevillensis]|uniref:ATP synthase gamma chain n=1 Tax=Candidatus Berkiella cookevillensis TaxID=437022 RepID=A0A0Q9YPX3_9GAMM|nr:F0F1 ATP synthase subunit gamma [Candidatus Berkiella cookevillensis]MCS5709719.1 F0F1 ATP synthase subunit gamma [Candidatus Berkiella cookevillensis]